MSVNHEVKGALAKLLATENLVIEHKKVSTAYFDVLNRVLTLPIWDKASSIVYDLLVGHEVGHALYTPTEDWSKSHHIPKDFVNVVEDARVEKLMKRRYPGLAKSFYNGYKELNEDDFFGISNTDMGRISLIDRINLHFKIGAHAFVPFSTEEQVFVDMTAAAETFDEVLEVCQRILEYVKDKKQEEQPTIEQISSANLGQGGESLQQEESEEFQDDTSEDSMTEQSESDEQGGNQSPSQQMESPVDETVSETQRTFNEEAEKLTNKTRYEDPIYVEVPKVNLESIVFENKNVREYLSKFFWGIGKDKEKHYGNVFFEADKEFNNYKKESQKEVNYLVKEFEMKKSADSYQRLAVSKSGVLDTAKLHTYKYNEDLFKKVSIIPDGKNHGLIFVLDWSGSMGNYLLDTVKQLFNLLWFCKKCQIPFEVYGFTQEWNPRYNSNEYQYEDLPDHYNKFHGSISVCKYFHLLNFFSSESNNKNFQTDCVNFWRLAFKMASPYGTEYNIPYGFDLSSTPLNESIMTLHQLIPQFKTKYKVQKTNVVLLTDGEANNITYDVNLSKKYPDGPDRLGNHQLHNQILRDRKLGRIYRAFSHEMPDSVTTILLENLKDNFPEINLIGFRILNGTAASSLVRDSQCVSRYNYIHDHDLKAIKKVENLMTVWRKEKAVELNEGVGYQALYAISSTNLSCTSSFDVADNATTKEIGKAFRGMLKKKTVNKKILSSFSSLIS